MPDRPNVLVIMTHDTGQHLSPYGVNTVQTPVCERLAAEGVLFEQSFCCSPLCSPSRAAAFTGRYPHQNGVNGLVGGPMVGGFGLERQPDEQHAAALFREAGYATVLNGFMHEARDAAAMGFESLIGGAGRGNNWGGDFRDAGPALGAWLDSRGTERPFYCQVGCHETHRDWSLFDTPPDESRGVWRPPYLADLPEVRAELAQMQGAIRRLDACVGALLAALETRGRLDDTIVVLTTDHGIDVPRAKGTFYDPGLRTMLLMRYPRWGAGRREPALVSNVDLLPTLLEACRLPLPSNLAGRSAHGLLSGQPEAPNDAVFAEKTFHDTYDPTRAVRTLRHKYIRYFEVGIFQDLRLASVERRHWFADPADAFRRHHEELYDLEADPWERVNLATEPEHRATLLALRRRLGDWMRATDDPLLRGPMASPGFRDALGELAGE